MSIVIQIENALIDRLRQGLGQMTREVRSYAGELDEALPEVVRALPAVWVTFGGVTASEPYSTSRQKYRDTGKFVVMVGCRNVRSEAASRHGGPSRGEVGTYSLIYAVRRLLIAQDMGLPIDPFRPGQVRTLYNTSLERQAFSVFACEFHCAWITEALPKDHWPCPQTSEEPDAVFVQHAGRLEGPPPDWLRTELDYHLVGQHSPIRPEPDAQDIINHKE